MAIYLARGLTGIPQKELARWMSATSGFTVAKAQQRFSERLRSDRNLSKLTRQIEKRIWSNVKT